MPGRIRDRCWAAFGVGWLLAAGLAFGQTSSGSPTQHLSASFDVDTASVLLFPGQSEDLSLEVAAHPGDTRGDWRGVQVRFRLQAPDGASVTGRPIALSLRPSGKAVRLGEWGSAAYFGLGASNRSLDLRVTSVAASGGPLELVAEVDSAAAELASTAPFELRCAQLTLMDIRDPLDFDDDLVVEPNSTAWMTHYEADGVAVPIMPRVVARVAGLPGETTVQWMFESKYARRKGLDDVRIPDEGWLELPGDSSWKLFGDFEDRFFGGHARVAYRVLDAEGTEVHRGEQLFQLLARNPHNVGAEEYIREIQGKFWFALAIARHESRQDRKVFNQFNNGGNVANEPNFGPPDGWGLFQIDSARGREVTREETWDWRTNAQAAMNELRRAVRDTQSYMQAIERTWPNQWERPPENILLPGTSTSLTWEEASIIQLYNGASIVRKLRNRFGTLSYFRSCWRFDPNAAAGRRWTFVPNRNQYVKTVLKNEIEGGIPVDE